MNNPYLWMGGSAIALALVVFAYIKILNHVTKDK